jgi:hypothetical protein
MWVAVNGRFSVGISDVVSILGLGVGIRVWLLTVTTAVGCPVSLLNTLASVGTGLGSFSLSTGAGFGSLSTGAGFGSLSTGAGFGSVIFSTVSGLGFSLTSGAGATAAWIWLPRASSSAMGKRCDAIFIGSESGAVEAPLSDLSHSRLPPQKSFKY